MSNNNVMPNNYTVLTKTEEKRQQAGRWRSAFTERGTEGQYYINNTKFGTCSTAARQSQPGRDANKDNKAANEIGAEGAGALSEALKVNTTLTILDLWRVQQQQQENAKFWHRHTRYTQHREQDWR